MEIGLFDLVIAFDHIAQKAWVFSSGYPESAPKRQAQRALQRLAWLQQQWSKIKPIISQPITPLVKPQALQSNFIQSQYQRAVSKMIDYIYAGDIFEANLSQRFALALPPSFQPLTLYVALSRCSPAPFSSYLQLGSINLISASPERFVQLVGNKLTTCPIKGTQARGQTTASDQYLAQQLVNSAKDRAENIMIVDLLRNDFSKVCIPESVAVPQLCQLETFAKVHHLVSTVVGTLAQEWDAFDVLQATFPGGSITGAPKIRAMEIIDELEPTRRGPYCGATGYIGFDGNMDTAIIIRSAVIKEHTLTFQVGGAVVADSIPEQEYIETLVKAQPLIDVLTQI